MNECEIGAIKVVPIEDVFVMKIDTGGSMPSKNLVAGAAAEVKRRASSLSEQLSELA